MHVLSFALVCLRRPREGEVGRELESKGSHLEVKPQRGKEEGGRRKRGGGGLCTKDRAHRPTNRGNKGQRDRGQCSLGLRGRARQ